MADIIVGKQVISKTGETGSIVLFENGCIHVDFKTRVAKFADDVFEQGYLKYVEADIQSKIDETVLQAKQAEEQRLEAARRAKEKALKDREFIQQSVSKTEFKTVVTAAVIQLDSAPLTFTNKVRKSDQELIQSIFTECDADANVVFESFQPKMKYYRGRFDHNGTSKYCVGFVLKAVAIAIPGWRALCQGV